LRPEEQVAQGPKARKAKNVVTFRCPAELAAVIDARTDERAGVKRTDAVVWLLEQGNNYVEATKDLEPRLRALREYGFTELGLLRRVLAAGLPIVEKELAGKK
jgi:hypothetical protein